MQRYVQLPSLRRLFFTVLFLLLAAALSPLLASAQQAPAISIQPSSGPPGTTVVISDLGGNRGRTCFLNGQIPIGTMAGSITYVVPTDIAPGTVLTFICQGGQAPPSNTVSFTVTGGDSDGDGLPDNADNCPQNAGPRENGGCPPPPPAPEDSDGDGIPDPSDACPTLPGPAQTGGCPVSPTAPPPPVVLPVLPNSGPCVVATLSAGGVNVRQGPSTQTQIVGALNPTQIYTVIGRNADRSWWQINTGWVSSTVTRFGGDCSAVAQTDGAPPAQTPPPVLTLPEDDPQYGLLLPAIQKVRDAASRLTNCPDLAPQVEGLPTFLALAVLGEPDPCAAAQIEIEALFLGGGQLGPYLPNTYNLCSNNGASFFQVNALFDETMNRLYHADRAAYDTLALSFGADDATLCSVSSVVGTGTVPDIIPDEMVLPLAAAHCLGMDGYADGLAKARALGLPASALRRMATFEGGQLTGGACELFAALHPVQAVGESNTAFFNMLVSQCGIDVGDAAKRAFSDAVRGALDTSAAMALGCDGYAQLDRFLLAPDVQPALPQIAKGDPTCTGNFRALATFNDSLGLDTLFSIMKSPNPCAAAAAYANTQTVTMEIVSMPACFEGPRLTLGDGDAAGITVLDIDTPWLQKIAAIDRILDRICTPILDLDLDLVFPVTHTPTPTPSPSATVVTATPTEPPTATPTPAGPTATPTLTIVLIPTATLPGGAPVGPVGPGGPGGPGSSGATGECFGCLPDTLLAPGGRIESVVVGRDESDQPGLYVLPAGSGFDPTTGKANFVYLPVDPTPGLLDGYPATLSPDGTLIGYFTRGGEFTDATRVIRATLPDGSPGSGLDTEKIALNFIRVTPSTDNAKPLPVEFALVFPIDLKPAEYAPAWSSDGTTLFMSLTDANGVTSIYVLIPEAAGETILPLPIAQNAFAPSVAPNWRYLTYERNDATGRNIYAMAFNSLRENPITQQRPGGECFGPRFGANSLKVFFTCAAGGEQRMYIYGLPGVQTVNTNVDKAQNPTPIEADGYIWFDDGLSLYLSAETGNGASPIAGENRIPWNELDSMSIAGPPGGAEAQ